MERTIATVIDTAAQQTRDLVGQASGIADVAHDAVGTVADVTAAMSRRAERRARKTDARAARRRGPRRLRVLVFAALGIAIVVVITKKRSQRSIDDGPAPDAFGAAVRAEHEITGNGASQPIATPGA